MFEWESTGLSLQTFGPSSSGSIMRRIRTHTFGIPLFRKARDNLSNDHQLYYKHLRATSYLVEELRYWKDSSLCNRSSEHLDAPTGPCWCSKVLDPAWEIIQGNSTFLANSWPLFNLSHPIWFLRHHQEWPLHTVSKFLRSPQSPPPPKTHFKIIWILQMITETLNGIQRTQW